MVTASRTSPGGRPATVLITGAAGGIGRVCAERFLAAGWRALGWDVTATDVPQVQMAQIDVSDPLATAEAGRGMPPLSAVVCASGVSSRRAVLDLDAEEWNRILAVNLSGCFHAARATFDALRAGRGTLILLGSIAATAGFADRSAYSVSKAGVLALTRCLAIEWAQHGIRVVSVSPTFTRTGMALEGLRAGQTNEAAIVDHTPQRRLVEPTEVAEVVFQVAQPGFSAVTGSEILVDAGFNALSGF